MLTVLQHVQRPSKDEPQRHEMLQAGINRTSRYRVFGGQLSPEHYSDQHIEIYESLSSGSQNRDTQ
jgi:hypothetical protein